MSNKLTQEELDRFVETRKNYFDLKDQLADITISEERIKQQKSKALFDIELAYQSLTEIHKEIQEKYGDGKVNLQTGEVNS
jgi:hypothetical protein